jgi:hypothetical protein
MHIGAKVAFFAFSTPTKEKKRKEKKRKKNPVAKWEEEKGGAAWAHGKSATAFKR